MSKLGLEIKEQIDELYKRHKVNYRIEFGNPKVMLAYRLRRKAPTSRKAWDERSES